MSDPHKALRDYASDLVESIPPARSRAEVERALAKVHRPVRRRLPVVVVASAGLFLIGNMAMAAISDPAVPGDTLYPVDKAYEWLADKMGPGGDRTDERLDESVVLGSRNESPAALDLVAQAMDDAVVLAAVEDIREAGLSEDDLRVRVLALVESARKLREAAEAGDFAARMAAVDSIRGIARDAVGHGIGNPASGAPGLEPDPQEEDSSSPSHTAPGPPSDIPGPPDDTSDDTPGPPDDIPGPPDDTPDDTTGPPSDSGAGGSTDTPGPPDDIPGPPDDTPGPPSGSGAGGKVGGS